MLKEDKVLDILRAPPSKPQERTVAVYIEAGRYVMQVNGRVIASAAGTPDMARKAASVHAEKLKKLTGKRYRVQEYDDGN